VGGLGAAGGVAAGGVALAAPGPTAAVGMCAWPGLGLCPTDGCPALSVSGATGAVGAGAIGGAVTVGAGAGAATGVGATGAGVGAATGVGAGVGSGTGVGATGAGVGAATGVGAGAPRRCRASHTPPAAPKTTPTTARMSLWLGLLRAGRYPDSESAEPSQSRGTNSVSDARSAGLGLATLMAALAWAPPISRV